METNLNAELLKMQEELDLLDIAVKHIDKARALSTVVVEAVKGVPSRMDKLVGEVSEKYVEYLENSKQYSENTVNQLIETHNSLLADVTKTIDEYKRVAEETETRSIANLKQAIDSYIAFVNKTSLDTDLKFKAMIDAHGEQIDEAQKIFDHYKELADISDHRSREVLDAGLRIYENYLEKSRGDSNEKLQQLVDEHKKYLENTQQQIDALTLSHSKEVEEMHKVIEGYALAGKRSEQKSTDQLDATLRQYKDFLNQAVEYHKTAINNISEIHKNEVKAVEHFTAEFIELSAINKIMMEKVDSVDFPVRLNSIDKKIEQLDSKVEVQNNQLTNDSGLQYKTLTTKLEAQDNELKMQKYMLIALLAVSVISILIALLK